MTADSLTVFVPTRLVNPTNAREHWATRAKRAKMQREAVCWSVLEAMGGMWVAPVGGRHAKRPKRITLTGHVARKFDTDGLQAALKSCRDGLIDCGLIHSDGPDSGHSFTYRQVVSKPVGVTISVAL